MKDLGIITRCRSCQSRRLRPFFNLGARPPANSLLSHPRQKETLYPLSLDWCAECGLAQLHQTLNPRLLFSQYLWVTGTSGTARTFAQTLYRAALARCPGLKRGYVLEVASNDGTFLLPFKRRGFTVLGVDPAQNLAAIARRRGVPTQTAFFGEEAARAIETERGQARLVIARNVLPHVADTRDFAAGLAGILHPDGVLAVEVHYAKTMLKELHYDAIYHEHLCYFTLHTLERLLNEFGLLVFDATPSPISGGSIVVYATKHKQPERAAVGRLRSAEARTKANAFYSWRSFAKRAGEHRRAWRALLRKESRGGKRIVGYGASARSSTLLNFCGIDRTMISVIADQNPLKHGRWTAGSRIPIKKPAEVFGSKPDAVCILAWNFKDEIMEEVRRRFGYRGKFIIPLPRRPYVEPISKLIFPRFLSFPRNLSPELIGGRLSRNLSS